MNLGHVKEVAHNIIIFDSAYILRTHKANDKASGHRIVGIGKGLRE